MKREIKKNFVTREKCHKAGSQVKVRQNFSKYLIRTISRPHYAFKISVRKY